MTKIRSLAEYNLSQEPLLNRLKIQLSQTHEQAVEVFKEYDKNKILLGQMINTSNFLTPSSFHVINYRCISFENIKGCSASSTADRDC